MAGEWKRPKPSWRSTNNAVPVEDRIVGETRLGEKWVKQRNEGGFGETNIDNNLRKYRR